MIATATLRLMVTTRRRGEDGRPWMKDRSGGQAEGPRGPEGGDQEMTTAETTTEENVPAELQPIRDLVNTFDLEYRVEQLTDPSVLRDWLVEHELLARASPVSEADLAATIELREALRAILRVNDGHPVDAEAVEIVNRAAGELPLQLRFAPDGEPVLGPLAAMLAGIALAKAQGTWARLKVCSSDTCQWAFYDRSKNRSGRWCSMQVCGNRTKTRAYRARQRD